MKKIFLFLLLLFAFINVNAKESVDVNIKWMSNVYYNYKVGDIIYWGQVGYPYVDDKIAYCLEIKKSINTSVYHEDEIEVDHLAILAGYFGYGYENSNNFKDYLAAQKLIWKYTDGYDVYFTTQSEGKGEVIDINSNELKIIDRINKYGLFPKFDSDFKFDYESINSIKDLNGIVSNFKVINRTTNKVYTNEDNLIIEAKGVGKGTFELEKEFEYKSDNTTYSASNSQKLIVIGNVSNLKHEYSYNVSAGSITFCLKSDLSNLSKEELLENKFSLYKDGKLINTYNLSETGCLTVMPLSNGNYKLMHEKITEGYYSTKDYRDITISKNSKENVTFYINPIRTMVKIRKEYGFKRLDYINYDSDVIYEIYDKDNNLINEIITDEYGSTNIILNYGDYRIVQSNTNKIDIIHDDFIIKKDEFKELYDFYVYDELYKFRVNITSIDEETTNEIDVFKFKFLDNEIDASHSYLTEFLDYGDYEVLDIESDNYELLNNFNFTINEESNFYLKDNELIVDVIIPLKRKVEPVVEEIIEEEKIIEEPKEEPIIIPEQKEIEMIEDKLPEIEDITEPKDIKEENSIENKVEEITTVENKEDNTKKLPFLGERYEKIIKNNIYYNNNFNLIWM